MIVNVQHTVKNAVMVFHRNGEVQQSVITLNSGTMIKVDHVQKQADNKANLHLVNGSVILNIDRDSISFNKEVNNQHTADMSGSQNPSQPPSTVVDNMPKPKRGGCCGGR